MSAGSLAVTEQEFDPLAGTPLDDISLEKILQNVEDNTSWIENDIKRAQIKDEAERTYLCFVEVALGLETQAESATRYQLKYKTINSWEVRRKKDPNFVPRILKDNLKSAVPHSPEDRIAYAYLLGVFANKGKNTNRARPNRKRKDFRRKVSDPQIQQKMKNYLERFSQEQTAITQDRIRHNDDTFVRVLEHNFHSQDDFREYVTTDRERIAFIQGYFELSKVPVRKIGSKYRATISSQEKDVIMRLAECFFELGAYGAVNEAKDELNISDTISLQVLLDLDLVEDPLSKAKLQVNIDYANATTHDLGIYYKVINRLEALQESGERIQYEILAQEWGLSRKVVGDWGKRVTVHDPETTPMTPERVKKYEALLQLLGYQDKDIYNSDQPVRRGAKVFFNVDGDIFVLPHEVQQQYLERKNRDHLLDEDIEFFEGELTYILEGHRSKHEVKIKNNVISFGVKTKFDDIEVPDEYMWHENNLLLNVEGVVYVLRPKTQKRYFDMYEIPEEPINGDHIDHLRELITHYVNDSERTDVRFTTRGNDKVRVISKMSIKENGDASWDETNDKIGFGNDAYEQMYIYHTDNVVSTADLSLDDIPYSSVILTRAQRKKEKQRRERRDNS